MPWDLRDIEHYCCRCGRLAQVELFSAYSTAGYYCLVHGNEEMLVREAEERHYYRGKATDGGDLLTEDEKDNLVSATEEMD